LYIYRIFITFCKRVKSSFASFVSIQKPAF
jgi:hypothetical protein